MLNNLLENLHFLRPGWLLLLPVGLLLLTGIRRFGFSRSNWEGRCDPALLKVLLIGAQGNASRLPLLGLSLIWTLAIMALAGPAWQSLPQPAYARFETRVLVFDLSQSMASDDMAPSRLVRARYKLDDLISDHRGREQGMVVFAGDAFVVSPITDDSETLANLVPSLDTTTLPVQGSRVDLGLAQAMELLRNTGASRGEVVLISDGVDAAHLEQAVEASGNLAQAGFTVSVLAVGTPDGAPVPLTEGGLLTDLQGNIVIPGLDRSGLQQIAAAGAGSYIEITADASDVNQLNILPVSMLSDDWQSSRFEGREISHWRDAGALLLLPLLLLVSLAFRRGWLLIMLVVLVPVPRPVYALEWESLWLNSDQRAARALSMDEAEQVPVSASNTWQAAAAYRRGEYSRSIEHLQSAQTADEYYNRGNAYAKQGQMEAAIESYQKALELDKHMQDAQSNLDLVRKLQQQQQQQQDQNNQQPAGNQQQQTGGGSSNQDSSASQQSSGAQQAGNDQNATGHPDPAASEQGSGAGDESVNAPGEHSTQDAVQNAAQNAGQDSQSAASKDEVAGQAAEQAGQESADQQRQVAPVGESGADSDQNQQALRQWLRQVPDDPGGLLRRKFHYQYSQRDHNTARGQQW